METTHTLRSARPALLPPGRRSAPDLDREARTPPAESAAWAGDEDTTGQIPGDTEAARAEPVALADRDAAREADRLEIRGAMAMVSGGFAVGVVLCGLHDPEAAVAELATEAATAGVRLRLDHTAGGNDVEVRRL